jgi:pimeloyl-ACP methyl ester carboxylesterase
MADPERCSVRWLLAEFSPRSVAGRSIHVPTVVIHGDADRILPIGASGMRTAKLVKGDQFVVVKDGPHCVTWTHAEIVTPALLEFLKEFGAAQSAR